MAFLNWNNHLFKTSESPFTKKALEIATISTLLEKSLNESALLHLRMDDSWCPLAVFRRICRVVEHASTSQKIIRSAVEQQTRMSLRPAYVSFA